MLRQTTTAIRRAERAQSRMDTSDHAQARRARTRHLIELGGLVQKAGLVERLNDDRAALIGAFLDLIDQLRNEPADTPAKNRIQERWRRRGRLALGEETTRSEDATPEGSVETTL